MKKRVIAILLLTVSAVFLTGCLQIDVDTGIDNSFNSYLSYTIRLDLNDVDPQYHEILINSLNNFGWHYQQENGFTASLTDESDVHTLTMKKSVANSSFSEAFDSLESMLTNESITAFMQVDMHLENYPRQDSYVIDTTLDIPKIISLSSIAELTPELLSEFERALDSSTGILTLTVPASNISESSHDTKIEYNLATMEAPLSFSEQTELSLHADILYSADGVQISQSYDSHMESLEQTRQTVLIAGGCVLALLLIFLLISYIRYRIRLRDYNS